MKQGIREHTATMMIPTVRGIVPGLIEARVCPPRMTQVVENPSLDGRIASQKKEDGEWGCIHTE